MLEVGERLAAHGYFVLLPDLFYRSGPYAPMNAKTVFTVPEERKVLMKARLEQALTEAGVTTSSRRTRPGTASSCATLPTTIRPPPSAIGRPCWLFWNAFTSWDFPHRAAVRLSDRPSPYSNTSCTSGTPFSHQS